MKSEMVEKRSSKEHIPISGGSAELGRYICHLKPNIFVEQPTTTSSLIVDGCAILHRQEWPKVGCIKDICVNYKRMIRSLRSSEISALCVVFDSYGRAITKDSEQKRRRIQVHTTADVEFDISSPVPSHREAFLSNKRNKQKLVNLLGAYLQEEGVEVEHAGDEGDADVVIVRKALSIADTSGCTMVVADDTDILVLFVVHVADNMSKMYLKTKENAIDIQTIRLAIGNDMIKSLLFAHAVSGCDTTSKPFGIGKTKPFKELQASSDLRHVIGVFGERNASNEAVATAGELFVKAMYSGERQHRH